MTRLRRLNPIFSSAIYRDGEGTSDAENYRLAIVLSVTIGIVLFLIGLLIVMRMYRALSGSISAEPVEASPDDAKKRRIAMVDQRLQSRPCTAPSDCSICLHSISESESMGVSKNCSHVFHYECIQSWLYKRKECPMCRTIYLGEVEE